MWALAVYSIKGGVGKTAAAVNIAAEAARAGWKTLLWDLDPQGASSYYFQVEAKTKTGAERLVKGSRDIMDMMQPTTIPKLHVVPADISYRNLDLLLDEARNSKKRLGQMVGAAEDAYHLMVLDCPPGITLLSENILRAADGVLVPVIPTVLSQRTLSQLMNFVKTEKIDAEIWPFLSMVEMRKRLHRDVLKEFMDTVPKALHTIIPMASVVERMGVERAPVRNFAPDSPAAWAFSELWHEVSLRLPYPRPNVPSRSR